MSCTGGTWGVVVVPGSCKEVLLDGSAADHDVGDTDVVGGVVACVVAEGSLEDMTLPVQDVLCSAEVTSESVSGMKLPVKGRLKEHIPFWRKELGASKSVLSIIESGYVLPLKSEPPEWARKKPAFGEFEVRVCSY